MKAPLDDLLDDLSRVESLGPSSRAECATRNKWIESASDQEVDVILDALLAEAEPHSLDANDPLIAAVLMHLEQRFRLAQSTSEAHLTADTLARISAVYRHLGPKNGARHRLLTMLTTIAGRDELGPFAELMATDPPLDSTTASLPFFPLMSGRAVDLDALFPRILDGLEHLSVAAAILDLANYLTRSNQVPTHPAAGHVEQLSRLLGGITQRLGRLEHVQCMTASMSGPRRCS